MTYEHSTPSEGESIGPEGHDTPNDEAGEVWATVESGARPRREGKGDTPDRRDPEYVLPYSDRERLGALFASLAPRLTAVALRLTRDPETAQDVVQNAFEKVLRHGSRYRGTARVSTWIHRIVINEALMWLRSQKRRSRILTLDPPPRPAVDEGPLPGEELDHARDCARLREELAKLPPDDRELLERCALSGVSYAEYAQRTGTHPAAVKSRAHRARRRLRSGLEEALAPRVRLA